MVLAQEPTARLLLGTAMLFKVCSEYRIINFSGNYVSYYYAAKISLLKDRFGDTARLSPCIDHPQDVMSFCSMDIHFPSSGIT